jgi:exodeoxyribonuclease VII large subunit
METRRRDYLALCRALPSLADLVALPRQKLDDVGGRLTRALVSEAAKKRRAFMALAGRVTPVLLARSGALRRERLGATARRLAAAHGTNLRQARRDLAQLGERHRVACVVRILRRQGERLWSVARLFQTLKDTASPEAILARGFALVRDAAGNTVRAPEQVAFGDALTIRVAKGEIGATVSGGARPRQKPTLLRRLLKTPEGQGSLF